MRIPDLDVDKRKEPCRGGWPHSWETFESGRHTYHACRLCLVTKTPMDYNRMTGYTR